ncbi:DUF4097 family beta strand repeat-containing protein [Amycolatopsis sp. H20-H5]|uniref:DUF4097 family beta strand repeat-containing protein n=1 Tax=Amycolatopsis sp. H20-H5 TaxID=3046309 RepID=UPI002DBC66E1|nr:DUF4097 family beta strand repeat-containing protein [Amycolatopsis sp. H20-H5]MEC3977508.1 DUF4097 family beta strand repeat-containing protein [Amycolatopsis sp. H20-H5]
MSDNETSNSETTTGDNDVRVETFAAEGPLEIDISLIVGRVEIRLAAEGSEGGARVEVRPDESAKPPWVDGLSGMLDWVGERFGSQFGSQFGAPFGGGQDSGPGDALREARVEKVGNRLVIQAAKALPLRKTPLSVLVEAPAGSHLDVRAGAADVKVTGTAGRTNLATGSGEITLERADGATVVRTGSGAIKLGPVLSGLQLRTGSGDVEAASLAGSATVATGTGDIWLGEVAGDVLVRSGSGDLAVAEAASGSLELITGSGEVRIGIRAGVAAEVDLTSSSGTVSSELDFGDTPPEGDVPLRVRGRTGSGNAVLTAAVQ